MRAGEITYGGRVTDMWDQRCLAAALRRVVSRSALSPEHRYSPCGRYGCPRAPLLADAQNYVDGLPENEPPGLFGMHDNANITYEVGTKLKICDHIIIVETGIINSFACVIAARDDRAAADDS